jgi:3-methyladenine DNA glycosylase Tag
MKFPGIVRNRLKIESAITNARCVLTVQDELGGFAKYLWSFVKDKPIVNKPSSIKQVPATSRESDALSKDLKRRGFKFVGSTIIYAHMQATGLVNDHIRPVSDTRRPAACGDLPLRDAIARAAATGGLCPGYSGTSHSTRVPPAPSGASSA